jgi:hypothetical protein
MWQDALQHLVLKLSQRQNSLQKLCNTNNV